MKGSYTIYIVLTALCFLTGCDSGIFRNYRPIEALQTVETVGLDPLPSGVRLSCAVAKQGDAPGLTVSGNAAGIAEGFDTLRAGAEDGQLFFAHTRFLLSGQAFAEQGIGSLLDFVERDVRSRMGTVLLLIRDGTAEAAVTGAGEAGVTAVLDTLEQNLHRRGVPVLDIRRTAVALSEYGAVPVCALTLTEESGLAPCGFGILTADGVAGWLDEARGETLGLLMGQSGTVLRQLPLEGGFVCAELSGEECSVTYLPEERALEISAVVNAAVTELNGVSGLAEHAEALEAGLSALVETELRELLSLLAAMDADGAGLGRALRRAGTEPAGLPDGWLQETAYRVRASVTVDHSFDMGEPARAEGGAA